MVSVGDRFRKIGSKDDVIKWPHVLGKLPGVQALTLNVNLQKNYKVLTL